MEQADLHELASRGQIVGYFGYGSLVNRATHRTNIVHSFPARLNGWQRFWRARPEMPGFPAALLTVREQADAGCDGLLVFDRAENLGAVDLREACYRRVALARTDIQADEAVPACPIFAYVAEDDIPLHPEPPAILQSYLDAVLQGFLGVHGEAGLARFFTETYGFETPLHADRADPAYPRAVHLTEAQRALIDAHLARHLAGLCSSPAKAG